MFYLVVYVVRVNGENCYFHSTFLHSSKESAFAEANEKKVFGGLPILRYYIDTVFLKY